MSASRTIQAASIPYLDNLSATASALYTSSCLLFWLAFFTSTCSPITVFWVCRIQFLPQGCGESLAHSLLHLILRVCWKQYQFNHLLLGLIVSRFGCIILLLAIPANFTTSSTFSPRTFFWISHISLRHKDKAKSLPHHFPLSSFAGKYSPRHSVLKGPWQFLFPVLTGLQVPVYKVKFVIRKFWSGGNYHQEAAIICSDLTMTHHRWRIFIKLSPLQF